MNDPWGMETPAANDGEPVEPLPPRLAELAALTGKRAIEPGERWPFAKPEELPEVQALARKGWHALDDAPLYCCLPATRRCTERSLDMTAQGITEAARDVLTWSDSRFRKWWTARGDGDRGQEGQARGGETRPAS
ncbi:hypothetical protein [Actinomadura rudentiformis]|uniref:Uncharacterized protein n=1 Tax=Actinomadura rudentiformis TaxID=359158 RepID=A0A6H9Z0Y5_9ACTN|nr:hypothetical protein [Actinomadura rudentiformis]KAB2348278.1 hypothetical protein F8566_15785 [Actinomadura rudentiformis]